MAAFLEFFHAIDKDKTGVITIDDLRNYMHRKRYKAEFVTTWTELFDPDHTGFITFENYCEVLGLKPASPKAAELSVKSESRKQEPSDSTASTQEIKASTTEVVQEVPVQRELVPNEEVEKPSHDDPVERRSATDSIGQENKELKNSENEESSKQPERGKDLVDATDTTQSGEKSSGSQSRKHKHSKSPSKKGSTQVESTAPTVEAQTAIPAQESGDSNMDIFDWLNTNSQQWVTFEDDDMNEEETLVDSGIPPSEDPASLKDLSTFSPSAESNGTMPVKSGTDESKKAKSGEAEIKITPAVSSVETGEASSAEHPEKALNKRGMKSSELQKRNKKLSESSEVSEVRIALSVERAEESAIPQPEGGPEPEEQTSESSKSDITLSRNAKQPSLEDKGPADVQMEPNPSQTDLPESAKSPVGKKGMKNASKSQGTGKKSRGKKASGSTESNQTPQITDETEIKSSVEQPMEVPEEVVPKSPEVPAALKLDMKKHHDVEPPKSPTMDEKPPIDIEMEISASTTEVVGSAVPAFKIPDSMEGSEKPTESPVGSQEPSEVMDVSAPPKPKSKSPLPKTRRQKRSSKSRHSESSNSGKREGKTSPKPSPEDANVEVASVQEAFMPPAKSGEGMHIVKKHPMHIIPSPTNVSVSTVPSAEKSESRSPEKPLESGQEGMDVEMTGIQMASPPTTEHSDEQLPSKVETEKTAPASEVIESEISSADHPQTKAEPLHIVKKHPMHIIPSPTNVSGSAVPSAETSESRSPKKPLESNQVGMDVEMTGVKVSSPPPAAHFNEQQPSEVEMEKTAPASEVIESEISSADHPQTKAEPLHIVKKHPMHVIPSPTNISVSAVPSVEKSESRSPEKPLESGQEGMDVEMTGIQMASPPTTEHSDEQLPSKVETEKTAPASEVIESEISSADHPQTKAEPLHIVKKHPMHIIPSPTNVSGPVIPFAPEENIKAKALKITPLVEGELKAEEFLVTSAEKQQPPKSGKKSPKSSDKKGGKKSPNLLPTNQEAASTVTDMPKSPVSPSERHGDKGSASKKKRSKKSPVSSPEMESKVDVDVVQESAEAEKHEGGDSSLKKPREKKPPESVKTEPKETSSSTIDVVEHHEPSGKKSPSSSEKKRNKKSPSSSVKSKQIHSNADLDAAQALAEVQKPSMVSTEQHEGRASPSKKRGDEKLSEFEEKRSTDVEMEESPSTADVEESRNLSAEPHGPSRIKSPSSSDEKGSKESPESSSWDKDASSNVYVDAIQTLDDITKSPVVSAGRPEGKDTSSKKRREMKSSESTKPDEKDPVAVETATIPSMTTIVEESPSSMEHQETARSRKKSPDSKEKRSKKSSESSPAGRQKSPLTGDVEALPTSSGVQESLELPGKIETSEKQLEEEMLALEVGEKKIDITESPIITEERKEAAKSRKKSTSSLDKKRGKKSSHSFLQSQEAPPDSTEAQESKDEGPPSKRKYEKVSSGSAKIGEDQSANVEAEIASSTVSTVEAAVPSAVHPDSAKSETMSPTKKLTKSPQKRKAVGMKTLKTELLKTPTKQKGSKSQKPAATGSLTTKPESSKTPKKQAAKAAKTVITLETPEVETTPTTSDLPKQSGMSRLGEKRGGSETKATADVVVQEAASKHSEESTPPKDSDGTDVKKSTSKRRKTTATPDGNTKGPRKTKEKTKDKKEKGKDKNKARKSRRRKRPQATEDGGEKAPVKKPKRPRVGHLECGRFPRSFPTQVGHRVKQHRRDGAPVSTHALGKAPKGTQTKMSIARRRRNKPSRAVKRWKLRSSLRRIGTIVILLAGRHRGKRAVIVGRHQFSGLLLITGPLKCNGIPVRRVHPDYVIATKTCIKMDKLRLPSRMQTKEYFARQKPQPRSKNAADNLFVDAATAAAKKAYKLKEERKEDQKLVDKRVIEAIKRNKHAKMLFAYLRSQFSLSRHDKPHKMVF
ncbi:60s ribosomal protein l6 [Echinococcus multilocularis]|uniref:Large ribosomal subunit protein eL6 n=1 Tax=Echinococcus multilocularis TaxID=6211 RepID=A0A068XV25_ECHMU|nr:60s ribosomal protein l6 [Echinococcus multilocularis]